jgi:uncharacterized membrane protein
VAKRTVLQNVLLWSAPVLVAASPSRAEPPWYTVQVIQDGVASGAYADPYAMSRHGNVCGVIQDQGNALAFLWNGGTPHSIAPSSTWGYGVNDFGVVVGELDADHQPLPLIVDAAGARTFSPLGGAYGIAYGINNAGSVVGSAQNPSGHYLPFTWSAGVGQSLPLPAGSESGIATSITEGGLITGAVDLGGDRRPVVWAHGALQELPLPAGQWRGGAERSNDNGLVIGTLSGAQPFQVSPIEWEHGVPNMLPFEGVGAYPTGLNADGLIVGTVDLLPYGSKGVLWLGGDSFDLTSRITGDSGWTVGSALAIDDFGRIVALGTRDGNPGFTILLVPVPGPSACTALAWSALIWTRRSRRRAIHSLP